MSASATCLLKYLARLCCDDDSDDDDTSHEEEQDSLRGRGRIETSPTTTSSSMVVESTLMTRPTTTHHHYQPIRAAATASTIHDDDDDTADDNHHDDCCCQCPSSSDAASPHERGLHEFFRKLRERWRRYDSMETFRRPTTATGAATATMDKMGMSPLRTASSYDNSLDIPTIALEEVVMPGSELQQQMARAVSLNLEAQGDECVICMEGFDPTNPRMPTLCGCGQNKTYFHLPCLYQWIEQSEECPSCRQKLRWEEF